MIPLDYARCTGGTVRVMGEKTLVADCIDCQRRTASREHPRVWFINPPTKWPCMQKIWAMVPEEYV